MTKRFPRQLSAGANNIVIALSENEVAKIYEGDTRSDIGSEAGENEVCQQYQWTGRPICQNRFR